MMPFSPGMRSPLSSYITSFEQDGFAVVRDVFTPQEVANMRHCIELQVDVDRAEGKFEQTFFDAMGVKTGQGDLISKIHLREFLLDDRILAIARALLPAKPLTYFGESTYQLGSSGRVFHRDNVDRDKATGPDWDGPYPLLRMGIYLQDHRRHSGGMITTPTPSAPAGEAQLSQRRLRTAPRPFFGSDGPTHKCSIRDNIGATPGVQR